MSLIAELKRRNVVRATLAYGLIAWVLLQAADFALDVIGAPNWIIQALTVIAAIGLPVVIVFSWVYEMTPEGLRREESVAPDTSITRQTGRKLDRVIIVFLAAALALVLGRQYLPAGTPERASPEQSSTPREVTSALPIDEPGAAADRAVTGQRVSVAVLPFVNMSADPDNEYFSDGVSEEILNVLASIPELQVAARTSAFAFKGTDAKIADIARELGVDHVLEGSVRKAGDQVRVTAQLIQADDGFHLWSETYDRQLDNIFAIQDDIAGQIASALRVTLSLDEQRGDNLTGTTSLEAYEHYLRGIALWHERTADSLRGAVKAFDAALEADPGFAKAHAGLALTWTVYAGYITSDQREMIDRTLEHAGLALERDPDNVEALTAKANALVTRGEFESGAELYEQALALNPSFATAYQWFARLRMYQGRYAEALELMQRGFDLDPRSRIIGNNLAALHMGLNDLVEARASMDRMLELHPEFPDAWSQSLTLDMQLGDCAGVAEAAGRLVTLLGKHNDSSDTYVALCETPSDEERHDILESMLAWGDVDFADPASRHLVYDMEFWEMATHFEDYDIALSILELMLERWGSGEMGYARNDRRPRVVAFNCSEAARAVYDARGVPPPYEPCD